MANSEAESAAETLRETNTGRLLLRAMRAFNERSMAAVRASGHPDLSLAHAAVLPHIDVRGTRLTELAERAQLRKQSAAQLVDELEKAGYVTRKPDRTDRRASLIVFTRKGQRFLSDAARIKQEIEQKLALTLGAESYRGLRHLLEAVPLALTDERD